MKLLIHLILGLALLLLLLQNDALASSSFSSYNNMSEEEQLQQAQLRLLAQVRREIAKLAPPAMTPLRITTCSGASCPMLAVTPLSKLIVA